MPSPRACRCIALGRLVRVGRLFDHDSKEPLKPVRHVKSRSRLKDHVPACRTPADPPHSFSRCRPTAGRAGSFDLLSIQSFLIFAALMHRLMLAPLLAFAIDWLQQHDFHKCSACGRVKFGSVRPGPRVGTCSPRGQSPHTRKSATENSRTDDFRRAQTACLVDRDQSQSGHKSEPVFTGYTEPGARQS